MNKLNNYYIKTNRTFSPIRKHGWLFTILVAIGGLWVPKLGLLVLAIMASLMISGFFTGRYWCGNFCPHGSLFDKILLPYSKNRNIPKFLKSRTFIVLFFIFFMYNFTRRILNAFDAWGTYTFPDKLGFVLVATYLVVLVVGGTLALFTTPRTWCQFCPMGSIQKATHALGRVSGVSKKTEKKLTISNKDACLNCGKCAKVCPFQLKPYLNFTENNQFNNLNCIKCSTCIENCPKDLLSLKTEKGVLKVKEDSAKVMN
ncbi:4Fe-4S binding domain-containing protein [Desulfonispora thiosulfatigenes DSM 11270]|uniref:4Fe-4S binding domain-containing protein n=1 Tax=Desulfonispora thiosulfatigenes DSM 11270 TaxID=656914 RepID=A0A1W1UEI3_DESTI|nr:4Fe-4S binding protein [Desulfonispora thiosulfatigenes]SMB79211.1 4Fe-4S binding domain-containing protein [Desulfonispora thiosulfatigenes DSM 11270]